MSEAETGAISTRSGVQQQGPPERQSATRTAQGTKSSVPGPRANRRLVLIAEDEEPIAEALTMIIEDAGYDSMTATHGRQALELARARRPDLVITDLMMPYLDGEELIAALHADAAHNNHSAPPIILMTAAGPRRAATVGADVVLRKPFNITDVEALLEHFLGPEAPQPKPPSATPGTDHS